MTDPHAFDYPGQMEWSNLHPLPNDAWRMELALTRVLASLGRIEAALAEPPKARGEGTGNP